MRQNFSRLPFDERASGDYTLTSTHAIDFAYGSFPYIENVTSVLGFGGGSTGPVPNEYNLQLNTQSNLPASGPGQICANAPNKQCTGWMQFVLDSGGSINMQYWAINYGPGCPGNLELSGPQSSCGTRAGSSFSIPIPAGFEALAGASLSGYVFKDDAGQIVDRVGISFGGKAYMSNAEPDIAGAFGNWHSAQFNVYGNSNGDESIFNSGLLIAAGLYLIADSADSVNCSGPGGTTTGESTNLTETSCVITNTAPPRNVHGIAFNERVAPVISSASPNTGAAAGGMTVTVSALVTSPNNTPVVNGFDPDAVLMFDSVAAPQRSCTIASCIIVSPPGSGTVPITAANVFANGMLGPSSAASTVPSTNNAFTYSSSGGGGGTNFNCNLCRKNGGRCIKVNGRWMCELL